MYKVWRKLKQNNGSMVVETSIVMTIVIFILISIIMFYLDALNDGIVFGDSYCSLYTYTQNSDKEGIISGNGIIKISSDCADGIFETGIYKYDNPGEIFSTEFKICTDRLRRWQLYGDVFSE